MATLAELLKGYTPPTESALADPIKQHFKTLPAQTAANLLRQRQNIDQALTMGNNGIEVGNQQALNEFMSEVPGVAAMTAYHGTPHNIQGKFNISKVGTGEGAQAYGHGMYFAENPNVAGQYKTALSNIEMSAKGKPLTSFGINEKATSHSPSIFDNPLDYGMAEFSKNLKTQLLDYPELKNDPNFAKTLFDERVNFLKSWGKNTKEAKAAEAMQQFVKKNGYPDVNLGGNLYKVDIPDADIPSMVNWDQQLKNQPDIVKNFIKNNIDELTADMHKFKPDSKNDVVWDKLKGIDLMTWANEKYGKPKAAELLSAEGIKGIRYLDEASRSKGKGTSNFVVFEPSTVKILEQNGQPTRKQLLEQQLNKVVE